MPGKDSGDKLPILKGPAAEKKVVDYVNEMNRPFGAADIFANLKGAVAKTNVQKILVSLAEKGQITQKAYAKTLVFVANQAGLDEMPVEKVEALEVEEKSLAEENKTLVAELKNRTQELTQLRNAPTNKELQELLQEADQTLSILYRQLEPLRSGQPIVTPEEMAHLDVEWQRWRTQWMERRKLFLNLMSIATDAMTGEEKQDLMENLGIEHDTFEHIDLENSPLCHPPVKGRR